MKQLQHTYETFETLETNVCNMYFQAQHLRGQMASTTAPPTSSDPYLLPLIGGESNPTTVVARSEGGI
jgi:hypothetical protein